MHIHAHDSYLTRSLEHVAASPLFDQSEKELITRVPEFFTHAYISQLYFGDAEQRALKPFVEKVSMPTETFKPIKEKIAQLRDQITTKEEKDMINFVHYLVVLLESATTDCSSAPSATRASAADVAEACRELILEALFFIKIINANVNAIAGNINAPCM